MDPKIIMCASTEDQCSGVLPGEYGSEESVS